MKDGLFMQVILRLTKINSDWYLWIHHTTDKIPNNQEINKKFLLAKKTFENQTGNKNSFRPVKIRKNVLLKKYESWK